VCVLPVRDNRIPHTLPVYAMTEESSFAVLVALSAALFVSGLGYTLSCSTQYECLEKGTCRAFGDGTCSFQNVISPAGYKIFNMSSNDEALAAMTRGVCASGERQAVDDRNRLICVRAPAFPTAYNSEAADPGASTDHGRHCGRWIRSKASYSTTEYFSFYDEEEIATDVTYEVKHQFNPLVVTDDIDRFRAACERMVVNDAVALATTNAYEHLKSEIGDAIDSMDKLLHAVGKLISHFCDTPLLLGVSVGSDSLLYATVANGLALDSDAATEALYAMGETAETREMARTFVSEMASAPRSYSWAPSQEQLSRVLEGAIQDTTIAGWFYEAQSINDRPFVVQTAGTLDAAARFLYAIEETGLAYARAYLLASASQCAFATRAATSGEFGSSVSVQRSTETFRNGRRYAAASLGRLKFDDALVERFSPVKQSLTLGASTVTWSSLTGRSVSTSSATDAKDACWDAAVMAFPDALDSKFLERLTTTRLVQTTLPELINNLKNRVAQEILGGRMSVLVADQENRETLFLSAHRVQFRVAGAPRNSALGREGSFDRPDLRSDDGALLMLLKQARSMFIDTIALALKGSDICDLPPIFPSLSRNAYLLTEYPCAVLLPGILVPPFASDRYDEKSLYNRIGFVIAHEVAHVASRPSLWNPQERELLLSNYSSSTHMEAAADLTAADAVVATGKTTREALCADVSQMWCGREPPALWGSTSAPARSHPPANERGDRICEFLRR